MRKPTRSIIDDIKDNNRIIEDRTTGQALSQKSGLKRYTEKVTVTYRFPSTNGVLTSKFFSVDITPQYDKPFATILETDFTIDGNTTHFEPGYSAYLRQIIVADDVYNLEYFNQMLVRPNYAELSFNYRSVIDRDVTFIINSVSTHPISLKVTEIV